MHQVIKDQRFINNNSGMKRTDATAATLSRLVLTLLFAH